MNKYSLTGLYNTAAKRVRTRTPTPQTGCSNTHVADYVNERISLTWISWHDCLLKPLKKRRKPALSLTHDVPGC